MKMRVWAPFAICWRRPHSGIEMQVIIGLSIHRLIFGHEYSSASLMRRRARLAVQFGVLHYCLKTNSVGCLATDIVCDFPTIESRLTGFPKPHLNPVDPCRASRGLFESSAKRVSKLLFNFRAYRICNRHYWVSVLPRGVTVGFLM
jgi:hypothetical protein